MSGVSFGYGNFCPWRRAALFVPSIRDNPFKVYSEEVKTEERNALLKVISFGKRKKKNWVRIQTYSMYGISTVRLSEIKFLWNFEFWQAEIVRCCKKTCFHLKHFLINSKTEDRRSTWKVPIKKNHRKILYHSILIHSTVQ